MRNWSLRTRLTALAAAVATLVLAATAALLLVRMRAGLVDAVDRVAVDRAREVAVLVRAGRSPQLSELSASGEVVVQVVGPQGQVRARSDNAAGLGRLFSFAPAPGARTVRQVALRGDTIDYRVAAVGADDDVVYAGAPVDDVNGSVALLAAQLAVGGPLLVALLAAGTWLLVGRTLRPVEVLRAQAGAVPATDLSRRVVVPDAPELAALATTLNDLLDRAHASAVQQRRFIGDAAHELRNPVAALLAGLELHQRGCGSPDAPELTQQAQRLAELVTDLLALARLDAGGRPAPVPVELSELVREQLAGRAAAVSAPAPAWVLGHAGLLRRALDNLVDNAERYARTGVTVSVGVTDGQVLLTVRDDGPGVPRNDRERIFERFTRLDASRSRDEGGVGLGLAIVRETVALLGGQVWLEDAGPGACVVVSLPELAPPPGPPDPVRTGPASLDEPSRR